MCRGHPLKHQGAAEDAMSEKEWRTPDSEWSQEAMQGGRSCIPAHLNIHDQQEEGSFPHTLVTANCPRLLPTRSHHDSELPFSSNELWFKTTLPSFLPEPNKSQPRLCLFGTCLWFAIVCWSRIAIPLLFLNQFIFA